jgi:HEPN domain-containing protein
VIPVAELDRIAKARLEDGRALLSGERYDGAAYVCGYAVELALKARICRTLRWVDFPKTSGEFQAYKSFQTHNLEVLLRLSGEEERIKTQHFRSWNKVLAWSPESRYSVIGTVPKADAESMIQAVEQLLEAI